MATPAGREAPDSGQKLSRALTRRIGVGVGLWLGLGSFFFSTAMLAAETEARDAPAQPGISAGPVTITFGGFVELATIYRNRNETADVSSNFNTGIPYPNSSQYHLSEFRESARQSRLSLLTQGPQDHNASVEAYFELDFQSSAPTANSVESNSYNPRLRHGYAVYRRKEERLYFLAGQAFSLATLYRKGLTLRQEQIPVTIDSQYVPGFNWTRNPQLRFVKEFDPGFALGVSLESPQTSVFSGPNNALVPTTFNSPGGFLLAPNVSYSTDVAPDLIAKLVWDPGYGHYEVYGLGRAFRDRANHHNDTIFGGGVGVGAILPVTRQFDMQLSALGGDGIGRYGSAQLPDVTVRPDGRLAAIRAYQALLGMQYRPSAAWTIYSYAGIEHANSRHFSAVVDGATLGYGYGNPLYDNRGCLTEGAAACAANTKTVAQLTAGAWWKYYQGALGNLQVGIQGSYTRRKVFEGLGGGPDVNMATGMVSFRFYPYQR